MYFENNMFDKPYKAIQIAFTKESKDYNIKRSADELLMKLKKLGFQEYK